MSLQSMQAELRGSVPKLPFAFTSTLINRAYKTIRNANLWSFQLFESSWITPPLINTGTVTAAQGSSALTFDATAITAINAAQALSTYSLITQRQFRNSAAGGIRAGRRHREQYPHSRQSHKTTGKRRIPAESAPIRPGLPPRPATSVDQ